MGARVKVGSKKSAASTSTKLHSSLFSVTVSALVVLLVGILISGPMGEELGWRGFLLPRLQTRFTVLVATTLGSK